MVYLALDERDTQINMFLFLKETVSYGYLEVSI